MKSFAHMICKHGNRLVKCDLCIAEYDTARGREHEASPDCWCNPRVEYVDPITGDAVYVHHKPN